MLEQNSFEDAQEIYSTFGIHPTQSNQIHLSNSKRFLLFLLSPSLVIVSSAAFFLFKVEVLSALFEPSSNFRYKYLLAINVTQRPKNVVINKRKLNVENKFFA